jgi:hypothetical protein
MADCEQVQKIWIASAAGWAELVCFIYATEKFSEE